MSSIGNRRSRQGSRVPFLLGTFLVFASLTLRAACIDVQLRQACCGQAKKSISPNRAKSCDQKNLLNIPPISNYIPTTKTKTTKESFRSGSTAEARITLGQGLQVYLHSSMTVVNGLENAFKKPNAKVMIHNNFYSTEPYGHTTKDSASGGKKGLLGAFTAGFIGGERYVINVVEEEYVPIALAVLKKVNAALVKELAANR